MDSEIIDILVDFIRIVRQNPDTPAIELAQKALRLFPPSEFKDGYAQGKIAGAKQFATAVISALSNYVSQLATAIQKLDNEEDVKPSEGPIS